MVPAVEDEEKDDNEGGTSAEQKVVTLGSCHKRKKTIEEKEIIIWKMVPMNKRW